MTPNQMIKVLNELVAKQPEVAEKEIMFCLSDDSYLTKANLRQIDLTEIDIVDIYFFLPPGRPDLNDLWIKLKLN